jgi:spore maturation protein CgeB
MMKVLIVGDWHSNLHEEVAAKALERLGHEVERFGWHRYFRARKRLKQYWLRAQNKYLFGYQLIRINLDLIETARRFQPNMIFIYRGTHVFATTIRTIREVVPSIVVVGYNNDDPFAPGHIPGMWRHFIAALPELDLALAYRQANIPDFVKAGAKRVELLRSWYVPEINHPQVLSPNEQKRFECDVVFVGHYESDMRMKCLEEVVKRGWHLRIFGHEHGWKIALRASPILRSFAPVFPVWGADYNNALCGAKIALCFLSKLNRDTYTRRCFEIPASGTMLMCERTSDMEGLFSAEAEADYFSSPEELGLKLDVYLRDEQKRISVAEAGRAKVVAAGHDVDTRMRKVVSWVEEITSAC